MATENIYLSGDFSFAHTWLAPAPSVSFILVHCVLAECSRAIGILQETPLPQAAELKLQGLEYMSAIFPQPLMTSHLLSCVIADDDPSSVDVLYLKVGGAGTRCSIFMLRAACSAKFCVLDMLWAACSTKLYELEMLAGVFMKLPRH